MTWHRVVGLPEIVLLALVPMLISFIMLWRALLGMEVFAPTDIVANESLFAERAPDATMPAAQNPLLSDVVDTFLPWRFEVRSQLAEGRFPLWNPYNLTGTHLHANLQSQVLSPFTLLWLLLPPVWGLGLVATVKWTLAGLGMALLLRGLGVGFAAAIFGSVAYQLCGPVVAWLQWPIADGLTWVPWMMWAAFGWLNKRRARWLLALSVLVAAEWLAGHIETTFHSLVFLGAFALASWAAIDAGRRARLGAILGLAGAGALGTCLAAAQILPFLDVLPRSFQWSLRSITHIAGFSLPGQAALMWLTPNGFGWPDHYRGPSNWIEANPYVGALTILLAVVGVALAISDRRLPPAPGQRANVARAFSPTSPLFWGILLVASASMAYGIPPLSLLKELPGFSSSFNWRLISVTGFCVIVLGAMGLERILSTTGGRAVSQRFKPAVWTFGLLAAALLVEGAQAWTVSSLSTDNYAQAWKAWAAVLFCAGALLILGRMLGLVGVRTTALLAVGLLTLDMVRAHWNFNPTSDFTTFYPKTRLTDFAAQHSPMERLAVVGQFADSNTLNAYKVADYRLYDATIDNHYFDFMGLVSPETFHRAYREQDASLTAHLILIKPSAPLMAVTGVRWVLTPNSDDPNGWQPAPAKGPIYKRTLTKNGFTIWENRYALPYAYLSTRTSVAQGANASDQVRGRMKNLSLDALSVTRVEDPAGTFPADLPDGVSSGDSVSIESYEPGEIRLKVKAQGQRFAVVNESWAPGWRAAIDGKPATIYRSNYVVQGVIVPAGEHNMTLVYDPEAFRQGVWVSLLALGVWLGAAGATLLGKLRRKQERKPLTLNEER